MINTFKDIIYNAFFREKIIISPDDNLKGKVIILTGASKGIGNSTAEVLLKNGALLTLVARHTSELKKTYSNNPNCLVMSADIRSRSDCKKVARKTFETFGRINVLINNAGVFLKDNLENISEEQYDLIMNTNIKGMFSMSSAVIPFMKKDKRGLIINMGSKISHNTNVRARMVLYATTKYAIEGFSYALGRELKPFGIRVTCLMPGTVRTFRSFNASQYLSPYRLGEIISTLVKYDDIHFESIILKSYKEEI